MIDRTALYEVMKRLETQKGPFVLFGLFLREASPGPWDLVVSAPWLESGRLAALGEVTKALADQFDERQLTEFSRIVTLDEDFPSLHAILNEVGTAHQPFEKVGHDLFGLAIREAYIFKAQQPRIAA